MAYDNRNDPHRNNNDIDVDVDQELKLKLDEKTKIDVATESKTKSEYDVDVDADSAFVKVDIDIDEDKDIKEEHKIKLEEHVRKDIDIDIDEDVNKDVDINIWETSVEVDAKNIIQGIDNDVNDIDNQKLIDVGPDAFVKLDDFSVRELAIGKSFNGHGNDSQYSVTQSNNLTDVDKLIAPTVTFFAVDGSHHGPETNLFPPLPHKNDDKPFQDVEAKGGLATTGDGTGANSGADNNDANGSVGGVAEASADGIATVKAFTQDILTGGNQQANFAKLDVVGGDRLQANDIKELPSKGDHHVDAQGGNDHSGDDHGGDDHGGGGHDDNDHDGGLAIRDTDNDVNDLDAQSLINVGHHSLLTMDDFRLDTVAIGESFNGPGNDMQFDFVQVNDLVDNDFVFHPQVKYVGPGGTPFQEVYVEGGHAASGSGTGEHSGANGNGLDGSVSGKTVATADAVADVSAFTQNIVMGANLQVNNLDLSVVGGDSVIADNIGV